MRRDRKERAKGEGEIIMRTLEELGYVKQKRVPGKEFLDDHHVVYIKKSDADRLAGYDPFLPNRIELMSGGFAALGNESRTDGGFLDLELMYAIASKIKELGLGKKQVTLKIKSGFIDEYYDELVESFRKIVNGEDEELK